MFACVYFGTEAFLLATDTISSQLICCVVVSPVDKIFSTNSEHVIEDSMIMLNCPTVEEAVLKMSILPLKLYGALQIRLLLSLLLLLLLKM